MTESTNNHRDDDWLAQIEQRVQDKVGDQWRSVKWSEFVKDVAWWLHSEKEREDEDTMEAIAGLIVYGIKTKEDLQNISDEKEKFRDALESKGVLPAICDILFIKYVSSKRKAAKTLEDGIPPLLQKIRLSPPSVPKEEDHAAVNVVEKDFGFMPMADFQKIGQNRSRCWDDVKEHGSVFYASENDVAMLVSGLVKDIGLAMALDLNTFTEVGAFGLRPDVWVVTCNMIPVGVIEVKKPDEEQKDFGKSILDKPTVLGELYDFQMRLPNFYGMSPAFGILTTFEAWRVCWIPQNDVDVDAIAKTPECLPSMVNKFTTPTKPGDAKKTSPTGWTPSKTNPVLHGIEDEDEHEDSEGETADESSRVLHVSEIYDRAAGNHLAMRAIAAALCKMAKVKQNPFDDPFDKLKERMLLRFKKGESRSIYWCRMGLLEGQGKWNKYANPKQYLYAIEDLGRGANGRVWLTCTSSGAVCVLKFPINTMSAFNDVELELKNWKKAYPEFESKVSHEKWCGREALRMPHFATVKPEERLRVLGSVKTTLETNFYDNGLVHKDVAWRNIGLYKGGAEQKAVVYDLGRVRGQTTGDDSWVNDAIEKLKREA